MGRSDKIEPLSSTHSECEPDPFKALITLAGEGNETRVTLTIADPKQFDEMIAFGAFEGGWQTLSRLEAFLATKCSV